MMTATVNATSRKRCRWLLVLGSVVVLTACGSNDQRPTAPGDTRPDRFPTTGTSADGTVVEGSKTDAAGPQSTDAAVMSSRPTAPAITGGRKTLTPDSTRPPRADSWSRIDDAPAALTEVSAADHGGFVWVAGGLDVNGAAVSRVFIFDPVAAEWSEGPRLPHGIHHAALVSTGPDLFLLGGFVGSFPGSPSSDVYRLDPDSDEWVAGPALPEPRGAGAAAWDGTRILFAGGVSPSGVSGEVWALEGDTWSTVGALSEPREHLAAASDGSGRTWFLAGRVGRLVTNTGRVDEIEGDRISSLDLQLSPRSGAAAFWHAEPGVCLAGGEGPAGTHAEVECIDPNGGSNVLPSLSVPRHGLGAAVVGDVVYVVLGGEDPGLFVSNVVETLVLPFEGP